MTSVSADVITQVENGILPGLKRGPARAASIFDVRSGNRKSPAKARQLSRGIH